jgi:hypothetical protein
MFAETTPQRAQMIPMSPETAPPHPPGNRVEADDWDILFRAVQTRLRQATDSLPTSLPIQNGLLECLEAFEHLRAMALREWHRPPLHDSQ